jgi:hypothetical protein
MRSLRAKKAGMGAHAQKPPAGGMRTTEEAGREVGGGMGALRKSRGNPGRGGESVEGKDAKGKAKAGWGRFKDKLGGLLPYAKACAVSLALVGGAGEAGAQQLADSAQGGGKNGGIGAHGDSAEGANGGSKGGGIGAGRMEKEGQGEDINTSADTNNIGDGGDMQGRRVLRSPGTGGGQATKEKAIPPVDTAQEFKNILADLGFNESEYRKIMENADPETIELLVALHAATEREAWGSPSAQSGRDRFTSKNVSARIITELGEEKFKACEADVCMEAFGRGYDTTLAERMARAAHFRGYDTSDALVRSIIVMGVKGGTGEFLVSDAAIRFAQESVCDPPKMPVSAPESITNDWKRIQGSRVPSRAGEMEVAPASPKPETKVVPSRREGVEEGTPAAPKAKPKERGEEIPADKIKLYQKNMAHLFKLLLNIEMMGRSEDALSDRISAYERMNAEDKVAFRKYFAQKMEELMPGFSKNPERAVEKLDSGKLDELVAELGLFTEVPPEFGAEKNFRRLLVVLGKYMEGKDFNLHDLKTSIEECSRALNNYLDLSSSSRADEWNMRMQDAFLATLQAKDKAALSEVKQKYKGRAASAVRLAERLWQNRLVGELMVDSVFGYDWEEITKVKAGEGFEAVPVVPGGEKESFLKESSSLVKLARLHKYVLSSPYFIRDKAAFIYTMEGGDLAEIEKSLAKSGLSEEEQAELDAQEEATNRLIDSPRAYLGKMDLLTQYVFCSSTWRMLKDSNLEHYIKEDPAAVDGSVEIANTDEDPAAKANAVKTVLEMAGHQLSDTGRAGHLGLMLNAIPLALNYSNSYNEVVDILGTIDQTANRISNTDMYSHLGSGRVLWYYSMVQVPKNFMEANMDNYDQLIDLMLKWPTQSGYTGTYMEKTMFEVRTVGEMLRRFMHVYARRSGAIRPGEIWPHRAPQDFSLVDIADRRGYDLARFARTALSPFSDITNNEELRQGVDALMQSSSDQVLVNLWNREPSLHDAFFDFFRPVSVQLVPQKRYSVVPMIPMSHSRLLRLLSGVEGIPRYVPGWDISGVGLTARSHGEAHGVESSTGEEGELEYRGTANMRVFGPEQSLSGAYSGQGAREEVELPEGRLRTDEEGGGEYVPPYHYTSKEDRNAWRAAFDDMNAPGWIAFSGYTHGTIATSKVVEETPEHVDPLSGEGVERHRAMSKVEDKNLIARLEHYHRDSGTDGVTLVTFNKQARKASITEGGETEVTADEEVKDLRAFTWGRIKGNWYRIGYIDLEPEELQRLFSALNLNGYGEFRQLSGRQEFGPRGTHEMRPEEQKWDLYGALVGFNLTNIFTGGNPPSGAPSVAAAGIHNRVGKRNTYSPELMGTQSLPHLATSEDYATIVQEFAVGASILFKGELAGMERPVCFVTAVGRKPRYEHRWEGGEYVTDAQGSRVREELKQGRGGAGALARAGKPIRKGGRDKAFEAGLAVEESWGDDVVGATFAWQDKQVFINNQYNIAIGNIVPTLGYSGLLGTMHTSEELEWFLLGDMRILTQRAQERSGQHSHAGELGAVETDHVRIQESVLWQRMQYRWTLEKITARLAEVEAEMQELRAAGPTQRVGETGTSMQALGSEISAQRRMDQLEREQMILRRMQTAIGLIEAQTLFGTASVLWDFMDEKGRAGIEALWGGPDQWSALLNSYVEVDKKFAAAFNIQPAPWGSLGGKVVIPLSGFILAATAGEYMRRDLKGPNANIGITIDPAREFGIGAIVGGMMRKSTVVSQSLENQVEGTRNVIEGMVLGWMPFWEGSRAQGYMMLAKEKGTNNYVLQENLDINRLSAGARLLWVGKNGIAYTVDAEWLRKKLQSEAMFGADARKLMEETKDTWGLSFEAKGNNMGGRARGVVGLTDRTMNSLYERENRNDPDYDPTNYKRVEWGVFADLFFTF